MSKCCRCSDTSLRVLQLAVWHSAVEPHHMFPSFFQSLTPKLASKQITYVAARLNKHQYTPYKVFELQTRLLLSLTPEAHTLHQVGMILCWRPENQRVMLTNFGSSGINQNMDLCLI